MLPTLRETNFSHLGQLKRGKVRDIYEQKDKLIIVTTDRQSAFDRILAAVPYKGQVLTQISEFWFENTRDIIANHLIAVPDPNVMVVKKCQVFPVEVVVRGYITGVTDTSAWVAYSRGEREFCGNILPAGLKKNQKFPQPIITSTTKAKGHDEKISPEEIIKGQLVSSEQWQKITEVALALFKDGTSVAAKNGLILVDTKYEFGQDEKGKILLIDEVHTPDSSRFWLAESYAERFAHGEEPENIDKEFLRLWFVKHSDPYHDKVLPPAPAELVKELSRRYIFLYEKITGQKFQYPDRSVPIIERIRNNLTKYQL